MLAPPRKPHLAPSRWGLEQARRSQRGKEPKERAKGPKLRTADCGQCMMVLAFPMHLRYGICKIWHCEVWLLRAGMQSCCMRRQRRTGSASCLLLPVSGQALTGLFYRLLSCTAAAPAMAGMADAPETSTAAALSIRGSNACSAPGCTPCLLAEKTKLRDAMVAGA